MLAALSMISMAIKHRDGVAAHEDTEEADGEDGSGEVEKPAQGDVGAHRVGLPGAVA